MKELRTPRSRIIVHKGEMVKVLAVHRDGNYDKDQLGYLVKYYGGNKIVKIDGLLHICEEIEEAEIVEGNE